MLDSTPIDAAFVGVAEKESKEESILESLQNPIKVRVFDFLPSLTTNFLLFFSHSRVRVEKLAAKSWLFLVLFPNNWPSHNAQATAICGHYCHVSLTVCRS